MAPVVHGFDPPERFVAGTVGDPGERTFFLQARAGGRLTSVSLEKQQVEILGERVAQLLDEVGSPALVAEPDNEPLEQPLVDEFRAGTITLSWDAEAERVVIEVFPVTEVTMTVETDEEGILDLPLDEPEPDEVLLVRMPPAMARAFAARASSVVAAGREQCPFCGGPIDPEGHLCPRANGYRRTSTA